MQASGRTNGLNWWMTCFESSNLETDGRSVPKAECPDSTAMLYLPTPFSPRSALIKFTIDIDQFFRYFEQLFHSKNLVTSGASHLEPLFRDAGFIDVQVIRRTVDVGDWRGGSVRLENIFTWIDPKTRALGCAAAAAFGDVWPTLADEFRTFIPDDEERKSFGERAAEEFKSGKYRCYFQMYKHISHNRADH